MEFIQNTPDDAREMLRLINVPTIEALFDVIPENARLKGDLPIQSGLDEHALYRHMRSLAAQNTPVEDLVCFLGAGRYDHLIPHVVEELSSRGEFYTAYTPYQAEASQGNLQMTFEYQTMMCELTGMDVSNASHYDGGTALAEAIGMAIEHTERPIVLISRGVHPLSVQVIRTFFKYRDFEIVDVPLENGVTSLTSIQKHLGPAVAAVVLQTPNFLGGIEDLDEIARLAHSCGALAIASCDPIALAVLKPPGEAGFDIACGDGQALGNEIMFGGPSFGFLAAKEPLMRRMPGRIVGETQDRDGTRGFVLTLQTREQHIRRERATSNICTNQALMAHRAAMYLVALGKRGLEQVARLCAAKARELERQMASIGIKRLFTSPYLREFAVQVPGDVNRLNEKLLARKFLGGLALERFYPEYKNGWLLAVTEKRTKEEIDAFVRTVKESKS